MTLLDNGDFRCDYCNELIPDTMLWVEMVGTYKIDKEVTLSKKKGGGTVVKAVYDTFRRDFCDMHCVKAYMDVLDMSNIHEAKHKTNKGKKKG